MRTNRLVGVVAGVVAVMCAIGAASAANLKSGQRAPTAAVKPIAAVAAGAAAESIAARRSVDEGNAGYIASWKAGDAAAFAALFDENGAMLIPGGRMIVGQPKIQERMKVVFGLLHMTEGRIETVNLFVLGDQAYETGKWWFTIGAQGKPAVSDSGRFVEVWKQQKSGDWKMYRDIAVPD